MRAVTVLAPASARMPAQIYYTMTCSPYHAACFVLTCHITCFREQGAQSVTMVPARKEKTDGQSQSYGGPNMSRQLQFAHGYFNLLTATSICSRLFQLLTATSIYSRLFQFTHGNFNLLMAISISLTAISTLLTVRLNAVDRLNTAPAVS